MIVRYIVFDKSVGNWYLINLFISFKNVRYAQLEYKNIKYSLVYLCLVYFLEAYKQIWDSLISHFCSFVQITHLIWRVSGGIRVSEILGELIQMSR